MKKVLLIRDFEGFSGGHLKVLHYIEHIQSSGFAMPRMLLTPNSVRDRSNIFLTYPDLVVGAPIPHDLLFLGGMDWSIAAALGILRPEVPIIGFIQSTRHANLGSALRGWLGYFATRVCVGEEVAQAILQTGEVNGPVHTITNGIESLEELRLSQSARTTDVLVSGFKDPVLAQAVGMQLADSGLRVEVLTNHCSRVAFLDKIKLAKVAVLIPQPREGAFLPSLEAMALDVAVVCPDTPGIHGYCRHDVTAMLPERSAEAIANAARTLLADKNLSARLRSNGVATAQYYTLERERAAFLPILAQTLGM